MNKLTQHLLVVFVINTEISRADSFIHVQDIYCRQYMPESQLI